MLEQFWLGMAIIFVSGILNGGFALPMKYTRHWNWENTWFVFSVVGIFLLPWVMAFGFVPHLTEVYAGVPTRVVVLARDVRLFLGNLASDLWLEPQGRGVGGCSIGGLRVGLSFRSLGSASGPESGRPVPGARHFSPLQPAHSLCGINHVFAREPQPGEGTA